MFLKFDINIQYYMFTLPRAELVSLSFSGHVLHEMLNVQNGVVLFRRCRGAFNNCMK